MAISLNANSLDLSDWVKSGDHIIWGQACGEPTTLVEALVEQRANLGPLSAFVGSSFSTTFGPEHADHISFSSMGAIGSLGRLSKAGVLDIVPTHVGQIYKLIRQGLIGCDVAMIQVSPAGPDGRHSFGLVNDYVQEMAICARVVIAEINDRIPYTICDNRLGPEQIDAFVEVSRSPIELVGRAPTEIEQKIARVVSDYIEDRAVIQMGIGAVPDAITRMIDDRRDLGVHSGMIGDGIIDLIERGIVTNARKQVDRGISVTGALIGTERLYAFADHNPLVSIRNSEATHGEQALAAIPQLVTINSAIEVDLTGQINAEQVGENYVGGTGGQVDYVRAGARSPGGRSIVALPATAKQGKVSRIVFSTSPVTTARSEADIIVTEFGAAELRGQTFAERAKRLIRIAHPDFQEELEQAAYQLAQRGF